MTVWNVLGALTGTLIVSIIMFIGWVLPDVQHQRRLRAQARRPQLRIRDGSINVGFGLYVGAPPLPLPTPDAKLINALHRSEAFDCACCRDKKKGPHIKGTVVETRSIGPVTVERIRVSRAEWLRLKNPREK